MDLEKEDLQDLELELSISGNPNLVDQILGAKYPPSADVRAYEDAYFDRDPDKWERIAEFCQWTADVVSPNSEEPFVYNSRCWMCIKRQMHTVKEHDLRIRLFNYQVSRLMEIHKPKANIVTKYLEVEDIPLEEHPF